MNLPLWVLAKSHQPILVGPWTSELGFESLYWLPYLDYLRNQYQIRDDRLVILTRGGAGVWYRAGHTVELYDYVAPKDLRLIALEGQQAGTGSINQHQISTRERSLVKYIATATGLRRYHWLHPSRMFQALKPWWASQTMGMADALKVLRFTEIPTPPVPVGLALPERFVAVRFYQRPTWMLQDGLLDWTHALIKNLAQTIPVVVLKSSAYVDDHVDFPPPTGDNITVVAVEPWKDNLAVQSAILKRASAFVGTWGGVAQLAVRLRVPTVAFFERWAGCSYAHRVLTEFAAMQLGVSCFVGRPHDIETVRSVLPVAIPLPDPPRGSSS